MSSLCLGENAALTGAVASSSTRQLVRHELGDALTRVQLVEQRVTICVTPSRELDAASQYVTL